MEDVTLFDDKKGSGNPPASVPAVAPPITVSR